MSISTRELEMINLVRQMFEADHDYGGCAFYNDDDWREAYLKVQHFVGYDKSTCVYDPDDCYVGSNVDEIKPIADKQWRVKPYKYRLVPAGEDMYTIELELNGREWIPVGEGKCKLHAIYEEFILNATGALWTGGPLAFDDARKMIDLIEQCRSEDLLNSSEIIYL